MSTNFWNGKKVIVTGGAGFLGKTVVNKLEEYGALPFVPRSEAFDLVERDDIHALFNGLTRMDMVIHLAAVVGGIGANMENPATYFYENLMMGVQLLHECFKRRIPKTVLIGTVCAYPKHCPVPFKEENLWDGYPEETNAPYGLAKKMLLVQSEAYRKQYQLNSIYLLPVNLYGPGDNFDPESSHVIPAIIRKCIEARESGADSIVAWGDGTPTREFLYVEDAAAGILLAAEKHNSSEPVNLGSAHEISISDLYHTITRLTGFKGEIVWDTSKPNGQPRRKLDVQKAMDRFGFASVTSFEQGLAQTIEWYERNRVS